MGNCLSTPDYYAIPPCEAPQKWAARFWFDDSTVAGVLTIKTEDLPGLMRSGLFLATGQIQEAKSHCTWELLPALGYWVCKRHYTLIDSEWTGHLVVTAMSYQALSRFRICNISSDQMYFAFAVDAQGRLVYKWDAANPKDNIDAIYDDMPLGGLWPKELPVYENHQAEREEVTVTGGGGCGVAATGLCDSSNETTGTNEDRIRVSAWGEWTGLARQVGTE